MSYSNLNFKHKSNLMAKQQGITLSKKDKNLFVIFDNKTKKELFTIDFSTHMNSGSATITDIKNKKSISATFEGRSFKHISGESERYLTCHVSE